MTIRQIPASGVSDANDQIDLTPAAPPINDYSNLGPDGEVLDEPVKKKPQPPKKPPRPPELLNGSPLYDEPEFQSKPKPPVKTRPLELKHTSHDPHPKPPVKAKPLELKHMSHGPVPKLAVSNLGPQAHDLQDDLYDNREVERVLALKDRRKRDVDNEYEDADALEKTSVPTPAQSYTPAGTYDNPGEIMTSFSRSTVHDEHDYDIAETNEAELYDDVTTGHETNKAELYDDVTTDHERAKLPLSPKFDDAIYMRRGENIPRPVQKPALMQKPPLKQKPPQKPSPFSELAVSDSNSLVPRPSQLSLK